MRLIWTSHATDDLRDIASYAGADNPAAARKTRSRVESLAVPPARQPHMGRAGAIRGMREAISLPSFRLVYQLTDDAVFILDVVHTARQWPPAEDEGD